MSAYEFGRHNSGHTGQQAAPGAPQWDQATSGNLKNVHSHPYSSPSAAWPAVLITVSCWSSFSLPVCNPLQGAWGEHNCEPLSEKAMSGIFAPSEGEGWFLQT